MTGVNKIMNSEMSEGLRNAMLECSERMNGFFKYTLRDIDKEMTAFTSRIADMRMRGEDEEAMAMILGKAME